MPLDASCIYHGHVNARSAAASWYPPGGAGEKRPGRGRGEGGGQLGQRSSFTASCLLPALPSAAAIGSPSLHLHELPQSQTDTHVRRRAGRRGAALRSRSAPPWAPTATADWRGRNQFTGFAAADTLWARALASTCMQNAGTYGSSLPRLWLVSTTPFSSWAGVQVPLSPSMSHRWLEAAITDWQTSQGHRMHMGGGLAGHYTPQQVWRGGGRGSQGAREAWGWQGAAYCKQLPACPTPMAAVLACTCACGCGMGAGLAGQCFPGSG